MHETIGVEIDSSLLIFDFPCVSCIYFEFVNLRFCRI